MVTYYGSGVYLVSKADEDVEVKRVCSTKLDNCRHPASDDWRTARVDSNADLHTVQHTGVFYIIYMYVDRGVNREYGKGE